MAYQKQQQYKPDILEFHEADLIRELKSTYEATALTLIAVIIRDSSTFQDYSDQFNSARFLESTYLPVSKIIESEMARSGYINRFFIIRKLGEAETTILGNKFNHWDKISSAISDPNNAEISIPDALEWFRFAHENYIEAMASCRTLSWLRHHDASDTEAMRRSFRIENGVIDVDEAETSDFAPMIENKLKGIEPVYDVRFFSNVAYGTGLLRYLKPNQFVVFAGRPGMGKTTFVLNQVDYLAKRGVKTAFFSLEMSLDLIKMFLMQIRLGVDRDEDWSRYGAERKKQITEFTKVLDSDYPCSIHDNCYTLTAIINKSRRLVAEGAKLIVVDYLQIVSHKTGNSSGNREQEVAAISRELKKLSGQIGVPVIALSQLSRASEIRSNRMPMMSDLRESGAIEQDADIIGFIHRPGYYEADKTTSEYQEIKDVALFNIAKHRGGKLGIIKMHSDQIRGFSDSPSDFFDDRQPAQNIPSLPPPTDFSEMRRMNEEDIPF